MAGARRFEELIAWQKARELTREIYKITQATELGRDYGLSRQIQRAAVSVMANIAEGFERSGHKEFHFFLSTAKASCDELRSHLYVALDVGYLRNDVFEPLLARAEEVGKVVGGLRASVKRRNTE